MIPKIPQLPQLNEQLLEQFVKYDSQHLWRDCLLSLDIAAKEVRGSTTVQLIADMNTQLYAPVLPTIVAAIHAKNNFLLEMTRGNIVDYSEARPVAQLAIRTVNEVLDKDANSCLKTLVEKYKERGEHLVDIVRQRRIDMTNAFRTPTQFRNISTDIFDTPKSFTSFFYALDLSRLCGPSFFHNVESIVWNSCYKSKDEEYQPDHEGEEFHIGEEVEERRCGNKDEGYHTAVMMLNHLGETTSSLRAHLSNYRHNQAYFLFDYRNDDVFRLMEDVMQSDINTSLGTDHEDSIAISEKWPIPPND